MSQRLARHHRAVFYQTLAECHEAQSYGLFSILNALPSYIYIYSRVCTAYLSACITRHTCTMVCTCITSGFNPSCAGHDYKPFISGQRNKSSPRPYISLWTDQCFCVDKSSINWSEIDLFTNDIGLFSRFLFSNKNFILNRFRPFSNKIGAARFFGGFAKDRLSQLG